ncbi:MAG: acylphosphatase [Betaproteobacteria bacterium]|nr:acylphosphatase [Betaproteobacteria bacterium]
MQTRHLLISGTVQGVGYRDGFHRAALRFGVTGWVRNRRDGRVEAVIQGTPAALESVIAWARRGPPLARVAAVEDSPAKGEHARRHLDFERLPTL